VGATNFEVAIGRIREGTDRILAPARWIEATKQFGFSLVPLVWIALGLLTVRISIEPMRQWVLEQRDRALRCRQCGYLLIGLETPRCPECGYAFDCCPMCRRDFSADSKLSERGSRIHPRSAVLARIPRDVLTRIQWCVVALMLVWLLWVLDVVTDRHRWSHVNTRALVVPTGMGRLPPPIAWLIHVFPPIGLAAIFWSCALTWKGKFLAYLTILASGAVMFEETATAATTRWSWLGSRLWGFGVAAPVIPTVGMYLMLGALCARRPSRSVLLMYATALAFVFGFVATLPSVSSALLEISPILVLFFSSAPPFLSIVAAIVAWQQIRQILHTKAADHEL
jgi:hypothetical protein